MIHYIIKFSKLCKGLETDGSRILARSCRALKKMHDDFESEKDKYVSPEESLERLRNAIQAFEKSVNELGITDGEWGEGFRQTFLVLIKQLKALADPKIWDSPGQA